MSAYLTLVKDNVDVLSLSRNNEVAREILENYDIVFDGETRLDNIDWAIESIDQRIKRMEKLLSVKLMKRDFNAQEFIDESEYLVELYGYRGQLYLINYMLSDAKFMKEDIYFRYG